MFLNQDYNRNITLELKPNTTHPGFYKEFYGRNIEQMSALIAEGRIPINVAQLMQKRLDIRNGPEDIKKFWMDNYFGVGDAIAYHPNEKMKVVLDSQTLREMTPDTQRVGGALLLTEDAYNALEGKEFKKGKLGKVETWLSKKDVKAHPIWKVLARDQALLDDYVDYIFAEGKQRFDYNTAMGFFPHFIEDIEESSPRMTTGNINKLSLGSGVSGRSLNNAHGRLVGLAFGNNVENTIK